MANSDSNHRMRRGSFKPMLSEADERRYAAARALWAKARIEADRLWIRVVEHQAVLACTDVDGLEFGEVVAMMAHLLAKHGRVLQGASAAEARLRETASRRDWQQSTYPPAPVARVRRNGPR